MESRMSVENAQAPTSQNLRARADGVVGRLSGVRQALQDILTKLHGSEPPPPVPPAPATVVGPAPVATSIGDAHQVLNGIEKLIEEIKGDL